MGSMQNVAKNKKQKQTKQTKNKQTLKWFNEFDQ